MNNFSWTAPGGGATLQESCGPRPTRGPSPGRSVFVIDPNKKVRLTITYPASTGRNFQEILRVIDSLQLTDSHKVATPVNWKDGGDVIIVTSVSDEEARAKFPKGWKALKPYLRLTPQPGNAAVGAPAG